MILFDWLIKNIDFTDPATLQRRAKKELQEKIAARQREVSSPVINPSNYDIPYSSYKPAYTKIQKYESQKMTREEKIKIIRNGKYWKERNLKLLESGIHVPIRAYSNYFIALVASDGNDILIPRKKWYVESDSSIPFQIHFDIPANTAIVGLFVYNGKGDIIKTKKFDIAKYPKQSTFTLNCNAIYGKNHLTVR